MESIVLLDDPTDGRGASCDNGMNGLWIPPGRIQHCR